MRAWIAVSARIGDDFTYREAVSQIRKKFKSDEIRNVLSVLGPYDVIVEVVAATVDVIYEKFIKGINSLRAVGGLSTYLAVGASRTKEEMKKPSAYMLVDASPERLGSVQEEIFEFGAVQKCDIVLGPYDIIVEVVTKDIKELTDIIAKVCRLNGVKKTMTMIVV